MYTNDKKELERVKKYVNDAINDGWDQKEYFKNEPIESACRLTKNNYIMSILTRSIKSRKYKYEVTINIWGPDGLSIPPGQDYDSERIINGINHCNSCGKDNTKTFRYSFSGRCCKDCLPAMKEKHEKPGWCD